MLPLEEDREIDHTLLALECVYTFPVRQDQM